MFPGAGLLNLFPGAGLITLLILFSVSWFPGLITLVSGAGLIITLFPGFMV